MVTGVHDRHHSLKLKFPGLFLGPAIANPAPHPGRNQSSRHLPPLPSSSMGRFFFDGWVHPSTEPTSHLWMQIRVASNRKRSTSADPPPTLLSRTHIPAHTYVALYDTISQLHSPLPLPHRRLSAASQLLLLHCNPPPPPPPFLSKCVRYMQPSFSSVARIVQRTILELGLYCNGLNLRSFKASARRASLPPFPPQALSSRCALLDMWTSTRQSAQTTECQCPEGGWGRLER